VTLIGTDKMDNDSMDAVGIVIMKCLRVWGRADRPAPQG